MGSETFKSLWSLHFSAAITMNDRHRWFSLWTGGRAGYTGVLCSSDSTNVRESTSYSHLSRVVCLWGKKH